MGPAVPLPPEISAYPARVKSGLHYARKLRLRVRSKRAAAASGKAARARDHEKNLRPNAQRLSAALKAQLDKTGLLERVLRAYSLRRLRQDLSRGGVMQRNWFSPLSYREFGILTAESEANLNKVRVRRQYKPLLDPPQQIADGLWRDQIFLPADAPVWVALDKLRQQGLTWNGLKAVQPDIQLLCVSCFDALDDGRSVWLGLVHDGWRFMVASGSTAGEALRVGVEHFGKLGVTDVSKLRFYSCSLREVIELVQLRARTAKIAFPARLWPMLCELDQAAELLAQRRSPIAEVWLAARRAEFETTALRSERRLNA
jgi:hypothetical protein